jgi:hypothetical protein
MACGIVNAKGLHANNDRRRRPRVAIAEGAHFRGSIDMQKAGAGKAVESKAELKPEAKPAGNQTAPAAVAR